MSSTSTISAVRVRHDKILTIIYFQPMEYSFTQKNLYIFLLLVSICFHCGGCTFLQKIPKSCESPDQTDHDLFLWLSWSTEYIWMSQSESLNDCSNYFHSLRLRLYFSSQAYFYLFCPVWLWRFCFSFNAFNYHLSSKIVIVPLSACPSVRLSKVYVMLFVIIIKFETSTLTNSHSAKKKKTKPQKQLREENKTIWWLA